MIRAYVTDAPFGYSVRIGIIAHPGDDGPPESILRLNVPDGYTSWEPLDPNTETKPTLSLDDASARALLDALTRHYAGAEDTRALRRDYDAERKRVDKLTGAVIDLAATLVVPSPHSEIQQRVHFKENL